MKHLVFQPREITETESSQRVRLVEFSTSPVQRVLFNYFGRRLEVEVSRLVAGTTEAEKVRGRIEELQRTLDILSEPQQILKPTT